MNHCLSHHTYIHVLLQRAKHSDKFGGPKGELISFIIASAYPAGLSGEEHYFFLLSFVYILTGHLLKPTIAV